LVSKEKSVVAVTGATGFVGSRLLKLLGWSLSDIRVLSRNSHLDYETVLCDFEKKQIPSDTFASVDTVFHLAGYAHDLNDASKVKNIYQKINVDSTILLAELAIKSGVKKFIFVSSVKAGGIAAIDECLDEESQTEPDGLYGKTKREAELKLLEMGERSRMEVSIIRPSLVYGPCVKGNLKVMMSGVEKGWFPPLPECRNRRSMIHVDDLVRALLLIAKDDRTNGEIYIATDGQPHSSREIYEAMCVVLGRSIPKWHVPKFVFDIAASMNAGVRYKIEKLLGDECYSSAKLESLGFKAKRTLKDMNYTEFQ